MTPVVLDNMLLLGVKSITVYNTFQDIYYDESLQSLLESAGNCFELPPFQQGIVES